MIMAPVLAYERKSGGGSYDALRASREHAGLQQRLAAASAHKHEYGASQFDPSQSSFPQHYPSHYPPKKQYRSSSIEYQPDYSKGEYVGGDYVDSEYFQREYLRESRREYRKKSWSGEYGGETQDIYGKYLRSNSYGKENLRMSMRGDYPRPSSRASFGEEQFRESLVDFYYRTPRGSQDYQGFQEYLRGPLEEYLESRSMSRSYESGIGRDEREYLHNFTHPRERTPHRRRRSRESFSVPSTLTRDRRASVGWSMREPLSVREVLDGPHVFFRFCPSLPACHIPRASVRLPRRHSSSSPLKVDRAYCGGGPPSRCSGGLAKSYSVEGAPPVPPHHHLIHHHHNSSILSSQHLARRPQVRMKSGRQVEDPVAQPVVPNTAGVGGAGRKGHLANRQVAADDCQRGGRWRNNSGSPASYELSQDFVEKRLEMLERRYGGDVARRAATTIQRAYRHYAMAKKFRAITATAKAQEKRLSRRFTVDVPDWTDAGHNAPFTDAEHIIRHEFDQLQRNLNAAVYGESRKPSRSLSLRDARTTNNQNQQSRQFSSNNENFEDQMNDSSLYCHVTAAATTTPTTSSTISSTSSSSQLQQQQPSQQTTTATTPTTTIPGVHSRNGSQDYQYQDVSVSYASSRDMKYFSEEDSGFGSQDSPGSRGSRPESSQSSNAGSQQQQQRRSGVRGKKVPPEVPRRTSSIKSNESGGSVDKSADNGSLSSVQSSGSDSSLSQSASDRTTPLPNAHDQGNSSEYHPTSPVWKRKNQMISSEAIYDDKRLSNISENSEDSCHSHSSEGVTYSQTIPLQVVTTHSARYANTSSLQLTHLNNKVPEVVRKRQYRVGLNLFNKKPERGISYLIGRSFLENSPQAVAKFLITRKGLSKQMIGEYLGNLLSKFNMAVLESFVQEIDLSGMQVDVALRKFQTYFRMPGEAQKIERLMQVFAQRYCQCNIDIVTKLHDPETIFVLAFAIIMLNTDLHTASMKQEKRMKIDDFVKNLRGIDDGYDIDREMLEGMYQRIKTQEFRPGHDHVTQVLKVHQTMVGKKPNLALPHRRLVCYCRLYEIPDVSKKERVGLHQREVFLFNDLLVVTKIFSKKKNSVTYTFRQSFPLAGLIVSQKEVPHYPYLIEIRQRVDNKVLITLNARNEHDRSKFCEDLKESICEMDEMESLRIEGELERQKASLRASRPTSTSENRDSGVADMEVLAANEKNNTLKPDSTLKRSALSNSLLDIHEAVH